MTYPKLANRLDGALMALANAESRHMEVVAPEEGDRLMDCYHVLYAKLVSAYRSAKTAQRAADRARKGEAR